METKTKAKTEATTKTDEGENDRRSDHGYQRDGGNGESAEDENTDENATDGGSRSRRVRVHTPTERGHGDALESATVTNRRPFAELIDG